MLRWLNLSILVLKDLRKDLVVDRIRILTDSQEGREVGEIRWLVISLQTP